MSLKNRLISYGLAGILGLTSANAVIAESNPRQENIIAKPCLETIIRGQVVNTLSEQPIKNVDLRFYPYLGNGQVGDLVCEYTTDSDGKYNKEIVSVEQDTWGRIKATFRDNGVRKLAGSSEWLKVEISHDDYYDAVRYVDLSNGEFNFDVIPVKEVEAWGYDDINEIWFEDKIDLMRLFDMWCRSINGCLQGWGKEGELAGKGPKNVYINTSPAYFSGNEITQDKIDLVYRMIDYLHEYGFIDKDSMNIEQGENPPDYKERDWSIIEWDDNSGAGYHGELVDGNEIYSGIVFFWTVEPNKVWTEDDQNCTYLEEIFQNFTGARTGGETHYLWNKKGDFLDAAYDIAKILKRSKIGSKSLDIDPRPF